MLQCCSHQSAAARGVTLPIITQGSISQTSPTRSSIPLYSSHFQIQVLHSHLPFFSSFFNSSESLHPPPHNTQLMQNKIFTTCKICPTPKFWVVYASGADWLCSGHWALGGDVGDQNIRIKGQTSLSCLGLDWYLQITPTILLMSKWTGWLMAGPDIQTGANSKWQIV